MCAEDEQLSVLNDTGILGCVIQTFGAFGHAEFGMDGFEFFLNVGNGATGVVKVRDLLRSHCSGSLGGSLIDDCRVLVGHLLTGKKVDERI